MNARTLFSWVFSKSPPDEVYFERLGVPASPLRRTSRACGFNFPGSIIVGLSQMCVMYIRLREMTITDVHPIRPMRFQLFISTPRASVKPVVTVNPGIPCWRRFELSLV